MAAVLYMREIRIDGYAVVGGSFDRFFFTYWKQNPQQDVKPGVFTENLNAISQFRAYGI